MSTDDANLVSTMLFVSVFPNLLFVSIWISFWYSEACSFDGEVVSLVFSFLFFELLLVFLSKALINIQFVFL